MFTTKHLRTGAASLVALLALAFGGSAIANATQSSPSPSPTAVTRAVDVATPGDQADGAVDVATPGDQADGAADVATPGDQADSGTESGSEIPGGDGPSGHADESPAQR
ncbi:MAG: hypothetical protein JWN65_1580 [Solirubrobacterales bacterium]|nr:hypothetical protein [Solirubrobacterales bacterium]